MFTKNLKAAMALREITQAELSRLTLIPKSGISQYISGKVIPKPEVITKIANALNVPVENLTKKDAEPEITQYKNVPVKEAARALGKSQEFVRVALQRGVAPFGMAVNIKGKKYTYHISPRKLNEYIKRGG